MTATLTDPDNITEGSVSWQWYRGANLQAPSLARGQSASMLLPNNCPIKDATSGTYRPAAGDALRTLNAVATYTDGNA